MEHSYFESGITPEGRGAGRRAGWPPEFPARRRRAASPVHALAGGDGADPQVAGGDPLPVGRGLPPTASVRRLRPSFMPLGAPHALRSAGLVSPQWRIRSGPSKAAKPEFRWCSPSDRHAHLAALRQRA